MNMFYFMTCQKTTASLCHIRYAPFWCQTYKSDRYCSYFSISFIFPSLLSIAMNWRIIRLWNQKVNVHWFYQFGTDVLDIFPIYFNKIKINHEQMLQMMPDSPSVCAFIFVNWLSPWLTSNAAIYIYIYRIFCTFYKSYFLHFL